MRFPTIRKQPSYTVSVPQLSGGVNYAVPPHLVADNQLSDVKNMWYRDGMLQTRPGVVFHDTAVQQNNIVSVEKAVAFSDKVLAYDFGETSETPYIITALVGSDGKFTQREIQWDTYKDYEGIGYPVSVLPVSVNTDASEELSAYDTILMIGFSNGDFHLVGYGEDGVAHELEPYIPIVLMNGRPESEEGKLFEPYNLLTNRYECQYTSDGEGATYYLPEKGVDSGDDKFTVYYTDSKGVEYTHTAVRRIFGEAVVYEESEMQTHSDGVARKLSYNINKGCFWFSDLDGHTLTLPLSGRSNNVKTTVCSADIENPISSMRISTWFGGDASGLSSGTRLFVSGDPKQPNLVHWSATNNPLYFPENNYAYVGEESSAVTGFGKQGELLVIFKDREIYCTQYSQGTVTAEDLLDGSIMDIEAARAVFPIAQLHPLIGCDCPNTIQLCNNRLVWLNSDGKVYGLFTAGQYSERNVRELSYCIEKKLRGYGAEQLKKASAAELEDNYLLSIGETIYVMDHSSSGFMYYSSYASDEKAQKSVQWYVWDLSETGLVDEYHNTRLLMAGRTPLIFTQDTYGNPVTLTFEEGAGDARRPDGIHSFTDNADIPCMFKTKLFEFDRPDVKKQIQQLYLSAGEVAESTIRVSYVTEQWEREDAFSAQCTDAGQDNEDRAVRVWRLTPNVSRVRTFGIRCNGEGTMAVQGILLKYQYQGVVR